MVQTRSRVAALRNTITVEASSSDSDSDEDIPAQRPQPRPSSIKSPVSLRPSKASLVSSNNGINKKKRNAGASFETPSVKRVRHEPTDSDQDEMDEAAMDAINAFNNRQTPNSRSNGIEVLLRSSGKPRASSSQGPKPNPIRRRLDGTDITETIGETPQSKTSRRPTPRVEESEPEEDGMVEEEDGIEDGNNQDVGREDGSPELDSSPPKPKQPQRGGRFPARMLPPAPTALAAPLRLATINNLRPPVTSMRSDGGQQRPIPYHRILPSIEVNDNIDVSGYQGDANLSESEEAEDLDAHNAEDETLQDDEDVEEAGELEEVLGDVEEEDDVEDPEEDDTQLHAPIEIQVPEVVDKRLIVTLESEHLNVLREIMGKEQWTDLGKFWELEIYGADGFRFGSESPPVTAPGKRCLRSLYAFRESLDGLQCPRDLNIQNEDLIRLHHRLNEGLTNVARKVAKIRNLLKQPGNGNDKQPVSSDTQQFIIPTLILTLRDLFLLGTPGYKALKHRALPPLPPSGKFTCVTVQYVTSITKRLSFLIRDLMDHCEHEEAPRVQSGWSEFSQVLDEWKFELQEKIGAVNEEMNRAEKIARDKAIKEHRKKLAEIELAKAGEQWNKMAASTQRMRYQPRPLVEKQRMADQYISPPQDSMSPPEQRPNSSSRPYSSYIETARTRPSTVQQLHAPPPRTQEVPSRWPPSRPRRGGLAAGQPSMGKPLTRQPPARQPQPHPSRTAIPPQKKDVMMVDSSPEPEPFILSDRINTPSRQVRSESGLEIEEVEEEEIEEEGQEFEDDTDEEGVHAEDSREEESQEAEEGDDEEEAFGKVWNISEKGFLMDELQEAEARGQGVTRDDLEAWSELFDCSLREIRRQILSLQREGLWQGSL
ncbi:hypothetical protein B0T21DRAFT_378040 [Apiosordaria backusii]|uniref:Uncharacterized protein n=1 Tax=Apiosordaria backusii TaxID=314023 RepID=A0AA40DHV8_9PEZI|nr:hypothetical protein B0T21DRAFT_378040 [Apiosordaria backusii]